MNTPQLEFVRKDHHLAALLGRTMIGSIFYNAGRSREDTTNTYVVGCRLPGIKERLYVSNEEEGKLLLQRCLETFLYNTGLK